jgi:hypothetical protein
MTRGTVRALTATAALIFLMHSPSNAETTAKKVEDFALSFHQAISNYKAETIDATLLKSRALFADRSAYESYNAALRASGNYEAVKKYNMTVTATASGAKAVKGDDGRWDVTFQTRVAYRPEQGHGLDQCLVVDVKVSEKDGAGLGVSSVVATNCPVPAK